MGKLSKVLIIALLILICFISYSNLSYAFNPGDYDPSGSLKKEDYDGFYDKVGVVLGFVRNLGAIISVLGIAVLGLRYMWGSLEQKANYKETMFPFIIGIAMTVGVTVIITIVQSVAEKI